MPTAVLIVTEDELAYRQMQTLLGNCDAAVIRVGNYPAAVAACSETSTGVIICDAEFDGHTWRDVLGLARGLTRPPGLIIISRLATDRLWLDVLDEGIFDLFCKTSLDGNLRRAVLISLEDWRRNT